MKKKVLLVGAFVLLLGVVAGWIFFGFFYVKMPKFSDEEACASISFNYVGEPKLQDGIEDYTMLVNAIESRTKTITFGDADTAAAWMEYFRANNPLAVLVDSYTLKNNKVKIKYQYGRVKQKNMIQAMRLYFGEYQMVTAELNGSEYGRAFELYHRIASSFQLQDISDTSIFDALKEKKADVVTLAKITSFLYNASGWQTYPVVSEDGTEAGVLSLMDDQWFYLFPGKETLENEGIGIHYFGCTDKFNEYVFGDMKFYACNGKENLPDCEDTRFSPIHWIQYYEILEDDLIRAHYQDWSVAAVQLSNLEKELEMDRGFRKTITEDGYRYYVFEPEEYFPKKKNEKYPLVVVLHGAGETSNSLFKYGTPMTREGFQEEIGGAYVAVMWSKLDYYRDAKRYNELVADIIAKYPAIDPAEVFIYGFSNGGVFSSEMLVENPDLYRGIMASGTFYQWSDEDIEKVKDKSIWLIGGAKDSHIICYAEDLAYQRLSEAGVDISYYEFPTKGHTPIVMLEKIDSLGSSATDWMKARMRKENWFSSFEKYFVR